MKAKHNENDHLLEYYEGLLKRFAKRFEPYGILIAVCALGVAFGTLWVEIDLRNKTLTALEQEKLLREETLDALKNEKVLREVQLLSVLINHFELSDSSDFIGYPGHREIFERVARTKMDLSNLDASGLDFSKSNGGINLNNANLRNVNFGGSDLSYAQLSNAKLNGADLEEAELYDANLINADLTDANLQKAKMNNSNLTGAVLGGRRRFFKETDLSGVNFEDAKGLQQKDLDQACADLEEPPVNLPKDSKGKQLIWKDKPCVEE